MIDNKLMTQREYNVVKSNTLIQKSRYDLSLQEQKILLRLIQMIEPSDKEFKEYKFSLKDFCDFCGIQISGKNYDDIKKTLLSLAEKKWWLTKDNGDIVTVGWVSKAIISPKRGIITVRLDEDLKPYLIQLQDYFTQYSLYYTIAMKSKYSIRLYELLKSYQNLKEKTFNIENIKKQLMAETYTRWADFKRKVIDIAIKEINLLSDIFVTYDLQKEGRQYTYINFKIRFKKDINERIDSWTEIENRLDKKQIKGQLKLAINEVFPNE